MKAFTFLLLFCIIVSTHAQGGRSLPPDAILHTVRHGGLLTYDVDVSKCDVKLPPTLPAYSFGDVMNDVYIVENDGDAPWCLVSTEERPVNTSRFGIHNGGLRVTDLELRPGHSPEEGVIAVITLTDIEQSAQGKVLAQGTLNCNSSSGGIVVNAQRMGGEELERLGDVMTAFQRGEALAFTVDPTACTKPSGRQRSVPRGSPPRLPRVKADSDPPAQEPSELWAGRISGYRIPGNVQGAVEFTAVLMSSTEREVFNVRLQPPDQVQVKSYALSRPANEPIPPVVWQCVLGTSGSFHIFRV